MFVYLFLTVILILIAFNLYIFLLYVKTKRECYNNSKSYQKAIEFISNKRDEYKKRCVEVEDALSSKIRAKVRKEVNHIHLQFNKFELVMILNAVEYMIKNKELKTEDIEIYITFIKRINKIIDNVKESKEDYERYNKI